MSDAGLHARIHAVARLYPAFSRGGLSFAQLRGLAQRWGSRCGLRSEVRLLCWPPGGSVLRVGGRMLVYVDDRGDAHRRREILAHEVGHLVLGHYQIDTSAECPQVWHLTEGMGASEWEEEADLFASFALRTPGLPLDWFVPPEQLRLWDRARLRVALYRTHGV